MRDRAWPILTRALLYLSCFSHFFVFSELSIPTVVQKDPETKTAEIDE